VLINWEAPMTDIMMPALRTASARTSHLVRIVRIVLVAVAVAALIAAAFVVGRVTVGSDSSTPTVVNPAAVQQAPANASVEGCHLHRPC
jgi:hypothetical protein